MRITILLLTMLSQLLIKDLSAQTEKLFYHEVKTDNDGNLIPWYNEDLGKSYSHTVQLVWNFWDTMRRDMNGLPYYMNHQVWNPAVDDHRGIGGDQFAMALSSWRLLYDYTGNEHIKENMRFIADYYITHGRSPASAKWPNIPFPYNTLIYSGIFDGDMRSGKDVAQPDKAGSFGLQLVHLYKIENDSVYLDYAIQIANTLAANVKPGDANYSPLPFKINVFTGAIVLLRHHDFTGTAIDTAGYTSNWAPTMQLFLDLMELNKGNVKDYEKAFQIFLQWMKKYPMQLNKWGPFFEDVDWWSETQINAMTFARFIMEHPQYFTQWKNDSKKIIDWVHKMFNNKGWEKYGVIVTNEQTVYPVPGESHTARQGADELLYVSLTGDRSLYTNAIRELTWATYTVDFDGKNIFPKDEPWLTDGYGDYVRHYLRAMSAFPELAPGKENHILFTTSVIQQADYKGNLQKYLVPDFDHVDTNQVKLYYRSFDEKGIEKIRMQQRPSKILLEDKPLTETANGEGFEWNQMAEGGVLTIKRSKGKNVIVLE
ncbi:MAG: hypothetical protein ACHQD7_03870 [Chitinophagales bacterium]